MPASTAVTGSVNEQYPWDQFDPFEYIARNYKDLLQDDLTVLRMMRDHFAGIGPVGGTGIDVGAGANLYPTLAMLPFCDKIELFERSAANRAWLDTQLPDFSEEWDKYWDLLVDGGPAYASLDPRAAVYGNCSVRRGDIFKLPRHQWSIGTMFFVAESITTVEDEFVRAVEGFIGALKPGAPFAAAFMNKSDGYEIGNQDFPAISVEDADVRRTLEPLADGLKVEHVFNGPLLRSKYSGMILALGRAGGNQP